MTPPRKRGWQCQVMATCFFGACSVGSSSRGRSGRRGRLVDRLDRLVRGFEVLLVEEQIQRCVAVILHREGALAQVFAPRRAREELAPEVAGEIRGGVAGQRIEGELRGG